MSFEIIDARWTSKVNIIKIKCSCGKEFETRADRNKVLCPKCGNRGILIKLKGEQHGPTGK